MKMPTALARCLCAALGTLAVLVLPLAQPRHTLAEEVECSAPYDDPATPCPLSDGAVMHGVINQHGGVNYFQVDTQVPAVSVHIELTELPADYDLYLADANAQLIAQSVTGGLAPEVIDTVLANAGTYHLYVVCDPSVANDPDVPYRLSLTLQAPPPTPTPAATPIPTASPTPPPTAITAPTPVGVVVPNVVGRTQQAAEAALRRAGLPFSSRQANVYAPSGTVATQLPRGGTTLSPGGTVVLVIATGQVEVPNAVGHTEQEAMRILAASGFHTTTTRRHSQTVPLGLTIGTNPDPGAVRPAGATVTILLSAGS